MGQHWFLAPLATWAWAAWKKKEKQNDKRRNRPDFMANHFFRFCLRKRYFPCGCNELPHTHTPHPSKLTRFFFSLKITKSNEWLTRRKSCDLRFIAWFVCAFPLGNFDSAHRREETKKTIFVSLHGVVAKRWDVLTADITEDGDGESVAIYS